MKLPHTKRHPVWTSLIASLIVLALNGCASSHKALLPDSGPTTLAVYNQHTASGTASGGEASAAGFDNRPWHDTLQQTRPESLWTRTTEQALEADFQHVPNPELTGYVFPHLTRQGHPVPGYSTRFRLYAQDAYALPGELPVPLPAETPRTDQGR